VIGALGRLLGDAGVNIASMQVGRIDLGGAAVCVLTLDDVAPQDAVDQMTDLIGAESVKLVTLRDYAAETD